MLSWVDLLENPLALRNLYDHAPLLQHVTLHRIRLDDTPTLSVCLDLHELPERTPERWPPKSYNVVQMTLELWGVRELSLEGWRGSGRYDFTICRMGDALIHVMASGAHGHFSALCSGLYLQKLSPHLTTERPIPGA